MMLLICHRFPPCNSFSLPCLRFLLTVKPNKSRAWACNFKSTQSGKFHHVSDRSS